MSAIVLSLILFPLPQVCFHFLELETTGGFYVFCGKLKLKLKQNIFVLGSHGKVLVVGVCRGVFCEKLLEASPVPDRANASWLPDGPAAGQG